MKSLYLLTFIGAIITGAKRPQWETGELSDHDKYSTLRNTIKHPLNHGISKKTDQKRNHKGKY